MGQNFRIDFSHDNRERHTHQNEKRSLLKRPRRDRFQSPPCPQNLARKCIRGGMSLLRAMRYITRQCGSLALTPPHPIPIASLLTASAIAALAAQRWDKQINAERNGHALAREDRHWCVRKSALVETQCWGWGWGGGGSRRPRKLKKSAERQ